MIRTVLPTTTKQPNLPPFGVRLNEVDHLDACEQHVGRGAQVFKFGRRLVDGTSFSKLPAFDTINGLADHVEQTALDASPVGIVMPVPVAVPATAQALRRFHCNGANGVFTDVLLGFENELPFGALNHGGVQDFGKCNPLGKRMSTTGPMTWAMVPCADMGLVCV